MTSSPNTPARDDDDDLLDALEHEGALQDASGIIVAGLLGAALGAGLGWLASRTVAGQPAPVAGGARASWRRAITIPVRDAVRDTGRDRVRDARRSGSAARKRVDARAGEKVDDVAAVARRTAEALERSRADVERQVERGLRDLRRAARRAARRIG